MGNQQLSLILTIPIKNRKIRKMATNSIEIWKDSPYPFTGYKVSNMGGIKRKKGPFWVMKAVHMDKDGYITTSVVNRSNNSETTARVHRLIALTFLENPNPKLNTVINHKNEIKYDNRVDNLEWTTISNNTKQSFKTGALIHSGSRPLKVTINKNVYYYTSYKHCAKALGTNRNFLQFIVDKKPYMDFIIIESTKQIDLPINQILIQQKINAQQLKPIVETTKSNKIYYPSATQFGTTIGKTNATATRMVRNPEKYNRNLKRVSQQEYLEQTGIIKY